MNRRIFLQSSTGIALAWATVKLGTAAANDAATKGAARPADGTWFNTEPTRMGWYQLRAADADLDPQAVIADALSYGFNAITMTAGGNYAFYPTDIPFHERSPSLTGDLDIFGGVVAAGRQHGIRVGARFDFSKQPKAALDAHPEWFFRNADGTSPTDNNGRYSPCLNTDFYHVNAIAIIGEVMDRYRPSYIYLNYFINAGICHCGACARDYRAKSGKPLPAAIDADYLSFLQGISDYSANLITQTVHERWPGTLVINADNFNSDGWHTESRTGSYLPDGWNLSASEEINRQRNSHPDKAAINVVINYSTNYSRLMVMPREEMKIRMYQGIAHGSPLTYALTGTTLRQEDRAAMEAVREVYRWHQRNADLYGLQQDKSRVLLLVEPEAAPRRRKPSSERTNRGLYRILTAAHVPVAISETAAILRAGSQRFDLVIVTEGAPTEGVREFVEQGGRALFINRPVPFGLPAMVRRRTEPGTAYVEIRDPAAFPSLKGVKYISCGGHFAAPALGPPISTFDEYPAEQNPSLTFVPPMLENPSEFAFMDQQRTNIPGLLARDFGKGRIACVPWDIGAAYNRNALPIHAGLLLDIVDSLLPKGRQIVTDAHPSIEMVLMRQPGNRRDVLHLINLSGQAQAGYLAPIPFQSVVIDIAGRYASVKARASGTTLKAEVHGERTRFTLPLLEGYEVIELG